MFLCNILGHLLHCCCSCVWVQVCEHCVYPGELSCESVAMILRSSKSPNFVAQTFDTCGGQTHKELVSCDLLIYNWRLNHNWNAALYLQRFEMRTFLKNPIKEIQTKSIQFKECMDYSRGKARVSWSPSQSCCEHWQRNSGRYTPFAQFPLLQDMIRDILTSKCQTRQIITSISNIL